MKKIFSFYIAVIFVFLSCKDENVLRKSELVSTQACEDYLLIENILLDIDDNIEQAFRDNGISKGYPNYTLKNFNYSFPQDTLDTLIVDFGNSNILYPNPGGKLRKGKIISEFTGKYHDSLSIINISFDNYQVNNYLVEGEIVIINNGKNIQGNSVYLISSNNMSVSNNSRGKIDWQVNISKEWINGEETFFNKNDDAFILNGTSSGNSTNNNNFSSTIMSPLIIEYNCLYGCLVTSGEVKLTPDGYEDRIIDYGNEGCDCNVVIITNSETYPKIILN